MGAYVEQLEYLHGPQSRALLAETLVTLAHYQEEQARTEADLLERETWALTVILTQTEPIWKQLPNPTLRFVPNHPDEPRLELGSFSHLAALIAPSADEEGLIAATTLCWARAAPSHARQVAGQSGALAYSYMPISVAEAVATLGFGRILAQIEGATRTACQALLAQAQAQRERQARLLRVERMLGWEPDPTEAPLDGSTTARARLVLLLLRQEGFSRLALGAVLLGLVMVLLCLVFGIP